MFFFSVGRRILMKKVTENGRCAYKTTGFHCEHFGDKYFYGILSLILFSNFENDYLKKIIISMRMLIKDGNLSNKVEKSL